MIHNRFSGRIVPLAGWCQFWAQVFTSTSRLAEFQRTTGLNQINLAEMFDTPFGLGIKRVSIDDHSVRFTGVMAIGDEYWAFVVGHD